MTGESENFKRRFHKPSNDDINSKKSSKSSENKGFNFEQYIQLFSESNKSQIDNYRESSSSHFTRAYKVLARIHDGMETFMKDIRELHKIYTTRFQDLSNVSIGSLRKMNQGIDFALDHINMVANKIDIEGIS